MRSRSEVRQVLDGLRDEREVAAGAGRGEGVREPEEAGGEDGGTEEAEEDAGTEQALRQAVRLHGGRGGGRDGRRGVVASLTPLTHARKHLTQLPVTHTYTALTADTAACNSRHSCL